MGSDRLMTVAFVVGWVLFLATSADVHWRQYRHCRETVFDARFTSLVGCAMVVLTVVGSR